MVRRICTKFGDSSPNTSRLVHVKLCAVWCRFVLFRAKCLGGSLILGHTVYGACVQSKRKHGNVSALINRAKKIRRQVRIAYQIIYLHYDRGNV